MSNPLTLHEGTLFALTSPATGQTIRIEGATREQVAAMHAALDPASPVPTSVNQYGDRTRNFQELMALLDWCDRQLKAEALAPNFAQPITANEAERMLVDEERTVPMEHLRHTLYSNVKQIAWLLDCHAFYHQQTARIVFTRRQLAEPHSPLAYSVC